MQMENKKRMPQQAPQAKADKDPAEQDTALVWGKNPVTELLKSEAGVDTLLLRYQHQARLGETISLRRGREDNCFRVSGSIGNSACFSAEFSLKALATEDHG